MIEKHIDLGMFNFEARIPDGEGIRVIKKFLRNLTIEIAKNTAKQIKTTEYPPSFAYREKQLHTVIAPAMDKVADNFLMESPVNRNWSLSSEDKTDAHGWVDYWCEHNDYCYYIEIKHGFKAYKSQKIRTNVKEDWDIAYKQLESLSGEISIEKLYAKGVFRVLIHVLPIYLHSSNKLINSEIALEELVEMQTYSMEEISDINQSNWSALWKLQDSLCKEYSFVNGYEKYPAVMMLVNVSEIHKK